MCIINCGFRIFQMFTLSLFAYFDNFLYGYRNSENLAFYASIYTLRNRETIIITIKCFRIITKYEISVGI